MGCHFLLQRVFLAQGPNPGLLYLLHWQVGSLPLAPPGNPKLVSVFRLKETVNIQEINVCSAPPRHSMFPLCLSLINGSERYLVLIKPDLLCRLSLAHMLCCFLQVSLFLIQKTLLKSTYLVKRILELTSTLLHILTILDYFLNSTRF